MYKVLVGLLFFLAGPLYALEALTLSEVLSRVSARQHSLQTARMTVTQKVRRGSAPGEALRGVLTLQKPASLRFEESHPERQRLISDGEKLWFYTPAAKQQLVGSWGAWVRSARLPLPLYDFLMGTPIDRLQDRYEMLFGGLDNGFYRVTLKPKTTGELPLTLWFSPETFFPMKGVLESSGSVLEWNIMVLELNPALSPKTFLPTVPKGTSAVSWNF